jgi:alpha-beta hydrolase superfamily lysophospholipase
LTLATADAAVTPPLRGIFRANIFMPRSWILKPVLRIVGILFVLYVACVALIYLRQRSMIFFPRHDLDPTTLVPWSNGLRTIGYCHEATNARTIWLMMHGNAGQAAQRDYVLHRLSDQDSLYVLEYPGYGARAGKPSRESFDQSASEAYQLLRTRNPTTPVCVLGESIGSGPACALARETNPPDKIVLAVPFDSLASVAARHFPFIPVRLLLRDNWNNVESLRHYAGPVEIFAALDDTVVPIEHAKALAEQIPTAKLIPIPGGHDDWSQVEQVRLRR